MKREKKNICGERIRKARESKDLLLVDLVVALHEHNVTLDNSALSNIETGKRSVMDYELLALSKVLDIDVMLLLEGDPEDHN